ncbi:hypothetical protein [Candidatus Williamhamiltonella defendens]|uniref:hypothetical protein n=1 Tax=Candidatus Williamhamiltonella defendens TaxID=138072 RepID=UPI001F2C375F|nr:hypothetical protein [Candidatus Hamiltonella defensa]
MIIAEKHKILNIFSSIDTCVCAASVRRFNKSATELDNTSELVRDMTTEPNDEAAFEALKKL